MADEARVLDALGDSTRRAVLELLRGGEQSVRELTDATAVSQPAVSQHLRVLRDAGLVTVRPDGARRLVERAVDGRTSVWGEVLAWEPPHRLVLTWHPGGDPDDASEVEVRFTASEGGGTRVELEHRGWERFGESAMLRRHAYVGPGAWGLLLDHVALTDLAMTAVAHALVHGRTDLAFGNTTCQDPQVLTDWVAATGHLTVLVAR